MNKIGMKLVVLAIAHLTAVLLTAAGRPVSSAKRAINPPGTAEGLPFSNGILVGNTLYVAGQEGSEERRVGKECIEPCRSRWSPYH